MITTQQAYNAVQTVLEVIGIGTILKGVHWLYERRKQHLEDRVLAAFHCMDDGPWHSAGTVVGQMTWEAALNDAPALFRPKLTGWANVKNWLRVSPHRLRFEMRRALLPSSQKAEKVLRDLWKRGLLRRADWDHTEIVYYRLKS